MAHPGEIRVRHSQLFPLDTKDSCYEVKSNAVREACLAVSAVKKLNRELAADQGKGIRKEQTYARARFRSRKNPSQTIFIHASALSHRGVYHTLLGPLKKREPIPHAHGDAKLTLRHHQYHLSVPFKRMGPHLGESNLQPKAPVNGGVKVGRVGGRLLSIGD